MARELTTYELELIDGFIMGTLDEGQISEFKTKLSDADFKEEYMSQHDIAQALDAKGDQEQKDFLKSIEKQNPHKGRRPIWQIALLGVVSLALLAWGIFHQFFSKGNDAERVFSDNFSAYTNVVLPSVRSSDNPNELEKAFLFYDQGKFAQAESAFESVIADTLTSAIQFYTAISELAQDKTKESLEHFQAFKKTDDFYPHSLWYRALILIKNEEDGAKALLEELLQFENPPFMKKAQALLEELQG